MSWRTARILIAIRAFGRRVGINRVVSNMTGSRNYEARFKELMLSLVRKGDCVWDVGANIGLYTTLFAEKVGVDGRVVAFEPSPANLQQLRQVVSGIKNVSVMPLALGDRDATAFFRQGEDPVGATSRIVSAPDADATGFEVDLIQGDTLVAGARVIAPTFIKIDTEGFELDVLRGLAKTLLNVQTRGVCVEVHFGLLEQRGTPDAPATIERLLQSAQFKCEWADASHIVAVRIDK